MSQTARVAEPISGDKLYQDQARRALPLLVRQAEVGQTVFYSDLAQELGMASARRLGKPLGSIGETIQRLSDVWGERIPPIQCVVVNKSTGLPGSGVGWFLDDHKDFESLSRAQKREIVRKELQRVYAFDRWREVLEALSLPYVTTDSSLARGATLRSSSVVEERDRRLGIWQSLKHESEPRFLRELGVYGGAQGIWVDKAKTASLSPDGAGVTVSLLHTGRHYPDDLSDDGLIYHYPKTARPASRDAAEVAATKNAARLNVPVFVIFEGSTTQTRSVQIGWVEDWDDEASVFLVLFGEEAPTYVSPADQNDAFALTDDSPSKKTSVKSRPHQQAFRFQVLTRYGTKCAVCSIRHPSLLKAAHIRGKREKGSDDWRNGLPLCSTHHDAFDAHLFAIRPDTLEVETLPGIAATEIGLMASKLDLLHQRPHPEALKWRYYESQRNWNKAK